MSRAELVREARTRLMAAGFTDADIAAVLIDGPLANQAKAVLVCNGFTDAEVADALVDGDVPARDLGSLLRSAVRCHLFAQVTGLSLAGRTRDGAP